MAKKAVTVDSESSSVTEKEIAYNKTKKPEQVSIKNKKLQVQYLEDFDHHSASSGSTVQLHPKKSKKIHKEKHSKHSQHSKSATPPPQSKPQQHPPSPASEQLAKKKKKIKPAWDPKIHSLLRIEPPTPITHPESNKKYAVRIVYLDLGKKKSKTIRFGDKRKGDFVADADPVKKLGFLKRVQDSDNLFNKNFWTLHLLYNKDTVLDSYMELVKEFKLV